MYVCGCVLDVFGEFSNCDAGIVPGTPFALTDSTQLICLLVESK